MRRIFMLLAGAGLLLTGCATGGSESFPSADVAVGSPESAQMAPDQIIASGFLALDVDDPTDSSQDVRAITQAVDGRIESESEFVGDTSRSISMTLRIPSTNFDQVIDQVSALGDVTMKQLNRSDVTSQVVDLDARIAALQVSIDRLEELFASAETVADLIAAETALAERQSQLDGLTAQREYFRDQVDMSSLNVTLTTPTRESSAQTVLFFGGFLIGAILAGVITAIVFLSRRGRST
jgi:hypothetical protein